MQCKIRVPVLGIIVSETNPYSSDEWESTQNHIAKHITYKISKQPKYYNIITTLHLTSIYFAIGNYKASWILELSIEKQVSSFKLHLVKTNGQNDQ